MSEREPIKDDGSTIDDSRTELERQRDDIEQQIDTLQTKDGADAFVAERKQIESFYVGKLSRTLRPVAEQALKELNETPTLVVSREITRLDAELSKVEQELRQEDGA